MLISQWCFQSASSDMVWLMEVINSLLTNNCYFSGGLFLLVVLFSMESLLSSGLYYMFPLEVYGLC